MLGALRHLAVEAHDAEAQARELLAVLRVVDLGRARLIVGDLAAVLHRGDAVREVAPDLVLDGQVGERRADGARRLAQAAVAVRLAVLDVANERVEGAPITGAGADVGALEVQSRHADVPAAVLLADEVAGRDAHVLKDDLVEDVLVGHVDQRPDGDARRVHRRHEVADALVLRRVRVGARHEEAPVRLVRVGRPDLGAVEHVVVAVLDRSHLQRGEVGAGVGLGVALAPDDVAGEDVRDQLFLLLLGAVDHECRAGVVDADDGRVRRAKVRQLLGKDDLLHERQVLPAVLRRPRGRDPAFAGELAREAVGEVPGVFSQLERIEVPVRGDLGLEEGLYLAAERFFFGREAVVHGSSPSRTFARPFYTRTPIGVASSSRASAAV